MKFTGDNSHVRRIRKTDVGKSSTVGANRRVRPTDYRREAYVVTKDYTDPFTGETRRKGDIIANRQGRNVQAQEQGNYRSYSQYNKIWGKSARLKSDEVKNRNAWLRRGARKSGRNAEALRTDPKVQRSWTQLYQIDKGKKDYSPRGNMHDLLVSLGLRDPNATYRVGETPNVRKKKS